MNLEGGGYRIRTCVGISPSSFRNSRNCPLCQPSSSELASLSANRLRFLLYASLFLLSKFLEEILYLQIPKGHIFDGCTWEESNLQPLSPQPSVLSIELQVQVHNFTRFEAKNLLRLKKGLRRFFLKPSLKLYPFSWELLPPQEYKEKG